MSSPVSLWETFAQVPDPRDASGRRHPLQAVLTLTSVAILSGGRSLYAIAQFGRDRGKDFAAALGFTRGCTPCCATLHYLFKDLDRGAFEAAIRRWARGRCESAGWEAVHVDGKTLRGTAGHEVPGVHVLAAYAHEARAVLDQVPVDAKTNEHKAALELLELIPVKGQAVHGRRDVLPARLVPENQQKRGDWAWPVKENQPELLAAIADAFDDEGVSPRERRLAEAERQTATSTDKGHGRLEKRTLTSTTSLGDGYLDWPHLGQCFKLVRERTVGGKTTTETVFGVTSLKRERADATRLLKLVRSHWSVERLFHVRDVTFGEDACRARTGAAPAVLSALRNAAITLLDQNDVANKAAALRRHAAHPDEALSLIRGAG